MIKIFLAVYVMVGGSWITLADHWQQDFGPAEKVSMEICKADAQAMLKYKPPTLRDFELKIRCTEFKNEKLVDMIEYVK